MFEQYLDTVCAKLQEIKTTQANAIRQAGILIGETIMRGNLVFTFGTGHSEILAREVVRRAGGLYPVVMIPEPFHGQAERLEGLAALVVRDMRFKPGDLMLIISNSGRNAEPIEMAMLARQKGLKVIVVTSMAHTGSVTSRHSSGKKLHELADIVLDNGVPPGDAILSLEGTAAKAGPVSTILGASVLQSMMVEAVQHMLSKGYQPPLRISANLEQGDANNQRLMDVWGERISLVFGMR
jgi:uncharacterized phosphosugar-binding protein